ncbi:hypothetical protein BC349_13385 [Flavihumibacter stibioxidans]|uniref:Uncharacterized protein n=1 Tax=Flavihumibacter stibioxidans TaxID=1834163 RepID=A0ABR7MAI8_9BACT|nr:hypothetical protein [Flavihumibacter stibioxidans]
MTRKSSGQFAPEFSGQFAPETSDQFGAEKSAQVTRNFQFDAVIRNFEIIDEAANRLPEGFIDTHSDNHWYKLLGFICQIVRQIKEHLLPHLLHRHSANNQQFTAHNNGIYINRARH